MNDAAAIAPLTKVTLRIESPTESANPRTTPPSINFDFVYGIATEGFTAFEKTLYRKKPGDRVSIHIEPSQMHLFFEHLLTPLAEAFKSEIPCDLDISVTSVSQATDRQLVQALARKSAGGGCDCGGGCGCGG